MEIDWPSLAAVPMALSKSYADGANGIAERWLDAPGFGELELLPRRIVTVDRAGVRLAQFDRSRNNRR